MLLNWIKNVHHAFAHWSCAIGILFAGFYTNWPLARTIFSLSGVVFFQTQFGPRGVVGELCTRKKMQSRIKTAINHSCWASFKYKSISIFHLEPSPEKRNREKWERYHRTPYWSAYMGEFVIFYDTTRVVEAPLKKQCSIKNVHTKWKLIFCPPWLVR